MPGRLPRMAHAVWQRRAGPAVWLLIGAAVVALTGTLLSAGAPHDMTRGRVPRSGKPAGPVANTRIKHVIEIMIENHTFDNLFGGFPGANGVRAATRNPTASRDAAPNVRPVQAASNEGDVYGGIDNSALGEQKAMDYQPHKGYQMNDYTVIPADGLSAITEFGPQFDPDEQYLASAYELADQNFQPVIAPTQPNVMTALNGTDHNWVYNNPEPGSAQPWNSIFDELTTHGRTWKIYYALPGSVLNGTIWDQIIPPGASADLTTGFQFFSDLADGALPDFSFIRPGVGYSTEPPEDIGEGDAWIGQLVKAVAQSQYWDSTAIFITYDEGGGFWDHVPPPASLGYGTRTPMIIVSAYARHGIYSGQTTNVSVLSFMQHLWSMPPLTTLNARQNDMMSAFNFSQAPLAPPSLPVAPADTIGFHGSSIVADIGNPSPGTSLTINLYAETAGLTLDSTVNGTVHLSLTPPRGVAVPPGFPGSVTLTGGLGSLTTAFPAAGFYRIAAAGPGGSQGWVTVDVGVNANTAPS